MLKYLGAAMLALTSVSAAAETVVVTADKMVDVITGKVIESPAVVIENGRITSILDSRTADWNGKAVKHINLAGKTILPGLIDMHVHLTAVAEIGGYRGLQYTDSFWSAVGVANAKKTLAAGFTSVRNVGSAGFQDVGLREAIDGGWVQGPRITTAAYAIGATGGHCDDNSLPPRSTGSSPR